MTPKVWRRKRNGRPFGSYYTSHKGESVNLGTKEAGEALKRVRQLVAGKWSPTPRAAAPDEHAAEIAEAEEAAAAAAAVDEALATEPAAPEAAAHSPTAPALPPSPAPAPPPAPEPPPSPPAPAPIVPEVLPPAAGAAGWERDAADAAGAAEDAAPTMPTGDPSTWTPEEWEKAAKAIVFVKVAGLKWWTKHKHYSGWVPNVDMAPEMRAEMVKSWALVLQYAGIDVLIPPWLLEIAEKLIGPGITVIMCTAMLANAFKADALAQKQAAEAKAAGAA